MFISSIVPGDVRTSRALEVARHAQDRVCLLEGDHARLAHQSDARHAANQEFEDYVLNRSDEDWLEITGYCWFFYSQLVGFGKYLEMSRFEPRAIRCGARTQPATSNQ